MQQLEVKSLPAYLLLLPIVTAVWFGFGYEFIVEVGERREREEAGEKLANDIGNALVRCFRQSFNKNQTLDEKFKTISYMREQAQLIADRAGR